jgi:hypothetical protein
MNPIQKIQQVKKKIELKFHYYVMFHILLVVSEVQNTPKSKKKMKVRHQFLF